jgi:hypothetical protein
MDWWRGESYLNFVGKINEHNFAWPLLTASTVQANRNDHVHATTLNEVVHSSDLEDLDSTGDD